MNTLDNATVILFSIISISSLVTLIFVALLLRRIDRNIDGFLEEFRENTNAKNTSLDRNFADIVREIKKVSYRLDAIYQELHDKDSSNKGK
jgi:hypothetical protein